jgi:hypothetical protein
MDDHIRAIAQDDGFGAGYSQASRGGDGRAQRNSWKGWGHQTMMPLMDRLTIPAGWLTPRPSTPRPPAPTE